MCVRCCTFEVGGCLVIGPALRSIQDDASDNAKQQAEAECARGPSPSPKPDWRAEKQWPLPCVDLQAVCPPVTYNVGHSCRCSRPRPALTALRAKTFAHTCCEYLQSSSHTVRLPQYLASRLPAHALLVICTSCLIVASSASYCKHALSFLSALQGIYRNQICECIAGH